LVFKKSQRLKRVLYFNNIYPLYRKSIWKLLLNENKYNFNVYYSKQILRGIKSFNPLPEHQNIKKIYHLKNYFFCKILIWQSRVIKDLIFENFQVAIFMGDMSVISTWIGSVICKLRKKKVYFWGHGLYGNESVFKKFFRVLFLKLADVNILYENRAKKLLIKSGFDKKNLKVVYNSLDYDNQLKLFKNLEKKKNSNQLFKKKLPIIVFIGRLTKNKKIDFLIKSVEIINKDIPKVNLLIIGEGPQKKNLELLSIKILNKSNFLFYGELYDENKIAELLYKSSICISPGNIGLTAIHSLSYGTPVASHKNFNFQMPEVESIIDGENGFLFREDDINDLSNKIIFWIENKKIDKKSIRKIIDKKYNPYFQKKILDKLILNG
tara:strand:+ start:25215 stop:26354 length:1140 start_codon:yes stop_codon:yes gene_type:complete